MDIFDLAFARDLSPQRRRQIRELAGLPRSGVARHVERSERTVIAWEAGETIPTGVAGERYGALLRRIIERHAAEEREAGAKESADG